ncbi:MAG TPA: MFS transporter [Kiloniellales bacterium]|nr:MFS transporter [Kiloniellales bacterium]
MLLLRVFVPFALGYFLSFLFRSINAVVGPRLAGEFALPPEALGFMTSAYFLTFAAAQLPIGLALDHFGPRRTVSFLLLFAALGAFLFAQAESQGGLVLGRALIGLGVAACLMSSLKAFVLWYPQDRLPTLNGSVLAIGGLGAVVATAPVEAVLALWGWRTLFLGLAGATLFAALTIFLAVPEKPGGRSGESLGTMVRGLGSILASGLFWRIGPLVLTTSAAMQSFLGLWGGPWLRDVGGYDATTASELLLSYAIAMTAGFMGMGWLTPRLIRRGYQPLRIAAAVLALSFLGQAGVVAGLTGVAWLWMSIMGFFGTAAMLFYAAVVPVYGAARSGRVSTALNLLSFTGAFLGQWLTGVVIGLFPHGTEGYAPAGYATAFGLLLALEALAFLWLLPALRQPPGPHQSATGGRSPRIAKQ